MFSDSLTQGQTQSSLGSNLTQICIVADAMEKISAEHLFLHCYWGPSYYIEFNKVNRLKVVRSLHPSTPLLSFLIPAFYSLVTALINNTWVSGDLSYPGHSGSYSLERGYIWELDRPKSVSRELLTSTQKVVATEYHYNLKIGFKTVML